MTFKKTILTTVAVALSAGAWLAMQPPTETKWQVYAYRDGGDGTWLEGQYDTREACEKISDGYAQSVGSNSECDSVDVPVKPRMGDRP